MYKEPISLYARGGCGRGTPHVPRWDRVGWIGLIQYCLSGPKTDMDNNVVVCDCTAMDRISREERKYVLNLHKQIKKAVIIVLLHAYNELCLHFLVKMNIQVVTDVNFICHTLNCTPIAHLVQLC